MPRNPTRPAARSPRFPVCVRSGREFSEIGLYHRVKETGLHGSDFSKFTLQFEAHGGDVGGAMDRFAEDSGRPWERDLAHVDAGVAAGCGAVPVEKGSPGYVVQYGRVRLRSRMGGCERLGQCSYSQERIGPLTRERCCRSVCRSRKQFPKKQVGRTNRSQMNLPHCFRKALAARAIPDLGGGSLDGCRQEIDSNDRGCKVGCNILSRCACGCRYVWRDRQLGSGDGSMTSSCPATPSWSQGISVTGWLGAA